MALTKLTKPRARWATFKLKVAKAVSRTLYDKLTEQGVSVRDFGARGDGINDDQPAVQAAIDYSIATNQNLFIPAGTYKINLNKHYDMQASALIVEKANQLTIHGDGTLICGENKSGNTLHPAFGIMRFIECSYTTIKGIRLDGNYENTPDFHKQLQNQNWLIQLAIYDLGKLYTPNSYITIEGVEFNDAGSGIMIPVSKSVEKDIKLTANVRVDGCTFMNASNTNHAIGAGACTGWIINNNIADNLIEQDFPSMFCDLSARSQYCHVTNNVVSNFFYGGKNETHIDGEELRSKYNTWTGNYFLNIGHETYKTYNDWAKGTGNTPASLDSGFYGMRTNGVSHKISDNLITSKNNNCLTGIFIAHRYNTLQSANISGNQLSGFATGIDCGGTITSSAIVRDNEILDCDMGIAASSPNLKIYRNDIRVCKLGGIFCNVQHNLFIKGNYLYNCGHEGGFSKAAIADWGAGSRKGNNTVVTDNTIVSDTKTMEYGIALMGQNRFVDYEAYGNTVIGATIGEDKYPPTRINISPTIAVTDIPAGKTVTILATANVATGFLLENTELWIRGAGSGEIKAGFSGDVGKVLDDVVTIESGKLHSAIYVNKSDGSKKMFAIAVTNTHGTEPISVYGKTTVKQLKGLSYT